MQRFAILETAYIVAVLQRHQIARSTVSKNKFQVGLHSVWAAPCWCSKQEGKSGCYGKNWPMDKQVATGSSHYV